MAGKESNKRSQIGVWGNRRSQTGGGYPLKFSQNKKVDNLQKCDIIVNKTEVIRMYEMKRACVYTRVSTQEQANEGYSIEEQERMCKAAIVSK